jgi:hypothetical protein
MNQPYLKYKNKSSYDETRFEDIYETAVELLEAEFLTNSPMSKYQQWENMRQTDLLSLSTKVLDMKKRKQIEWEALLDRKIETDEQTPYIRFWPNHPGEESEGEIEAKHGIERILEQYAELFELVREPLGDLAVTLDGTRSVSQSDIADVLEFLQSNDEQSFAKFVEPQLRHGTSHASIELDDSREVVEIYDNRGHNRSVVETVNYEEIPVAYYRLSDLVAGLMFAITRVNDRVILRYVTSQEFRCRIAENMPPDAISGCG